jgi:hypothetical protein
MKHMRYEVLTVVTVKFTVFSKVTPCSLTDHYQTFSGNQKDGGGRFFRNFSKHLSDCTALSEKLVTLVAESYLTNKE